MATFEREVSVYVGETDIGDVYVGSVDLDSLEREVSMDLDAEDMYEASSPGERYEYVSNWVADDGVSLKDLMVLLHENLDPEDIVTALFTYRTENNLPPVENIAVHIDARDEPGDHDRPDVLTVLPTQDFVKVAYTALRRKNQIPNMPEFIQEGLREYFNTPAQVSGT